VDPPRRRNDSGQASIEAVCGIGALILAGLVCFQLLAAGYTLTMVDGAAEAGAVAMVRGQPIEPAVRRALPGWARSRTSITRVGESLRVRVKPPSPLASVADALAISSTVSARPK
jgi:hypothetical protein